MEGRRELLESSDRMAPIGRKLHINTCPPECMRLNSSKNSNFQFFINVVSGEKDLQISALSRRLLHSSWVLGIESSLRRSIVPSAQHTDST